MDHRPARTPQEPPALGGARSGNHRRTLAPPRRSLPRVDRLRPIARHRATGGARRLARTRSARTPLAPTPPGPYAGGGDARPAHTQPPAPRPLAGPSLRRAHAAP